MLWTSVDEREPDPTLRAFCPERGFFSTSLTWGIDQNRFCVNERDCVDKFYAIHRLQKL